MADAPPIHALFAAPDMTVSVGNSLDIGVLWFESDFRTVFSVHGNSGKGRTADIIAIRDLSRRMLVACETQLAADRAKAAARDRLTCPSPGTVDAGLGGS